MSPEIEIIKFEVIRKLMIRWNHIIVLWCVMTRSDVSMSAHTILTYRCVLCPFFWSLYSRVFQTVQTSTMFFSDSDNDFEENLTFLLRYIENIIIKKEKKN